MSCKGKAAEAAHLWLGGRGDEETWPSFAPVQLACDILKMLASRGKPAGASPLCRLVGDEDTVVNDLEALNSILQIYAVVGKIGSLLAWVENKFCTADGASPLMSDGRINAELEKC